MIKSDGNGGKQLDTIALTNLVIKILGFLAAAIAAFYITIGTIRSEISDAAVHRITLDTKQQGIEKRLTAVEEAVKGIQKLDKKIDSLIIVLQ